MQENQFFMVLPAYVGENRKASALRRNLSFCKSTLISMPVMTGQWREASV